MTDRIIELADERKEFVALEDGYSYYWPKEGGALSTNDLRVLADELDRRNAPWDKVVKDYFKDTKDVEGM